VTQSLNRLENKRLLEVAREYERQGYRVVRRPGKAELPDFLSGFTPDLIAYGAAENVVVEVRSKSTLSGAEDLTSLSSAVNATPGWRLDLVVTNPRSASVIDTRAEELDRDGIRARVETVRHLLRVTEEDEEDAAALLAWSAAEATLRAVARRHTIALEREQPALIVKKLYSLGALGREEYEVLQEALRFRNAIVHGYRLPESKRAIVDELMNTVTGWLETDLVS
jgi:uncharacterized protein YutE (UPF0331/DUF86 family)